MVMEKLLAVFLPVPALIRHVAKQNKLGRDEARRGSSSELLLFEVPLRVNLNGLGK